MSDGRFFRQVSLGLSFLALTLLEGKTASASTYKQIVRGDGQYPPQEFTKDGALVGLHIDIVDAVAKELGWKLNWRSVPWKRALKEIEEGKADIITFISKNPERVHFAWFPDEQGFTNSQLSTSEIVFFTLHEHAEKYSFDGNLQELASRNFKIGVADGFDYGQAFNEAKFKVEKLANEETMLKLLIAKRIDLGVGEKDTVAYLMMQKDLNSKIKILHPFISSTQQHAAFSKKKNSSAAKQKEVKEDARKFAEALSRFKETEHYREIQRKNGFIVD